MDKETISSYGFIVISALLISILLALVSPVGETLGTDIISKSQTLVYNTGVMDADSAREYGTVVVHYKKGNNSAQDFKTYKTSARINEKCYIEIPNITGYEPTYDINTILATGSTMNQIVADSVLKEVTVVYKPVEYTIKYVLNGGKSKTGGTIPDATYQYGSTLVLPNDSEVIRDGYKFIGWFEDSGLGGERVYSIKPDTYGNKTFYAKYAIV